MRYEAIGPLSQADAEEAVRLGQSVHVVVLSVALHEEDSTFAERFCAGLAGDPDPNIRGNAVLGFGHIARRFGRLDSSSIELVRSALADPSKSVRGQAEAAADDITQFTGKACQ